MPKKPKEERALFIPQEQSVWETFVEDGFEGNRTQGEVLLRKYLSLEELQTLELPPLPKALEGDDLLAILKEREEQIKEALAQFVLDWNIGVRTPSGEAVKADPPAVAGGGQFDRFLGPRIAGLNYDYIRNKNLGLVKAARSTPLERTADTIGDSSSTPSGTEAE